ncbi:MAG: type II toxin-antitoxin system YafQ family toxin [Flavobacteriales bacterium]|nr:type II toxin-antitoxin system YafQ family toxin [Flavobacteriales bacterium]
MYELEQSNLFKKDIKLAKKRGLDMKLIDEAVTFLVMHGKLPQKFKPHLLKGNYKGLWECHIKPDWLLIWKQDDHIKLISLTRTGTHSDLF